VLKLPKVGPRMGKLQATSPLLVVRGQPPAEGLSTEREPFFKTDMLQLPAGRRRDNTSFQLSGMYTCKRRNAKTEVRKNNQYYDWKEVLFKVYHLNPILRIVYDYITKFCRQAQVIQHHENIQHVRNIGQGEALHRKYKRFKLGGGQTQ
jgi:hypothetical protein